MILIKKALLTACATAIIALLSGCANWTLSRSRLPDPQETTNSIEMGRFPKTAESSN